MKIRHYGYSLLVLIACAAVSCKEKKKDTTTGETHFPITVNATENYSKKNIRLQDIADVEYLPLQTTGDFRWKGQTVAAFTDKYIVNAEPQSGTVLVFDRNGKPLKHFNHKGNSDEQYSAYCEFLADSDNEEIYVTDRNKEKVFVYDMNGKLKRLMNFATDMYYHSLSNYDKNRLIGYNKLYAKDEFNEYFLMSKLTGDIEEKKAILPSGEKLDDRVIIEDGERTLIPIFSTYPVVAANNGFMLNELSNDTIFRLNNLFEVEPYLVQSPGRASMKPEVFLSVSMETDNYVFMHTVEKKFDISTLQGFKEKYLVFDKNNNQVYEQDIYNSDFTSAKPFNILPSHTAYDNPNVYVGIIKAEELTEAYCSNSLSGQLKEIAANLKKDDNPVLVIAKFK